MFSYVLLEGRIAGDHPLRRTDAATRDAMGGLIANADLWIGHRRADGNLGNTSQSVSSTA